MSNLKAKVIYKFSARDSNELTVDYGEIISIVKSDTGDGWSVGRNLKGEEGFIPTNYIEIISSQELSIARKLSRSGGNEKDFNENCYFDSDDDDIKSPEINNSFDVFSLSTSESTQISSIKMSKNFLKNGGKEFIIGEGEFSLIVEAEVEIVKDSFGEKCVWKSQGKTQNCTIVAHSIDSKFRGIKTIVHFELKSPYTDKTIHRRYSQFEWLHAKLTEKFPCLAIPPLPSKNVVGRLKGDSLLIRKRQLQKWLNYVTLHPVLSFSNNINHFLSITDKDKWKIGKRVIEKDQYRNGGFYFAVKAPEDEVDWENYSKRIGKVSQFVENYERSIHSLHEEFIVFLKRQNGSICKGYQKIGSALINLSESMTIKPDNTKNELSLLHGIRKTGSVYQIIGQLFREQAKADEDIVEDNIEEIDNVIKVIPTLVDLAKSAVMTVDFSTSKTGESKFDMETVEKIDQRARVITRTVDAELNWLQSQRESQLRSAMSEYLKNQVKHYTQITTILREALACF